MSFLVSPLRFLPLEPAQLSLATVLKCGQTFLWRKSLARATLPAGQAAIAGDTQLHEWSYGHRDRTIVLRQDANGLHYRSLYPATSVDAYAEDLERDTTLAFLRRYFVLDLSLPELYKFWSARDKNFAAKTANGTRFGGIRILRQPTWECLIEFICSSNNHISRIEGMLRRISRLYGKKLPSAVLLDSKAEETEEDQVFAFPTPADLIGDDVTASLRAAGFGYRDAYVTRTAELVCDLAKEDSTEDPEAWLEKLSEKTEAEAREGLLQFSGVGPKVADCILLFGCGFGEVVPVDTHVYQIAVRDYGMKGSRDATVNKAMYAKVNEKLRAVWGDKAGWAHQILFTADLRSFSDYEDPLLASVKTETVEIKLEYQAQIAARVAKKEEIEEALPAKRKRKQVSYTSAVTPGRAKRSKATSRLVHTKTEAEEAYPTPPETPQVQVKVEQVEYFAQTCAFSLAERVKRTRRASKGE